MVILDFTLEHAQTDSIWDQYLYASMRVHVYGHPVASQLKGQIFHVHRRLKGRALRLSKDGRTWLAPVKGPSGQNLGQPQNAQSLVPQLDSGFPVRPFQVHRPLELSGSQLLGHFPDLVLVVAEVSQDNRHKAGRGQEAGYEAWPKPAGDVGHEVEPAEDETSSVELLCSVCGHGKSAGDGHGLLLLRRRRDTPPLLPVYSGRSPLVCRRGGNGQRRRLGMSEEPGSLGGVVDDGREAGTREDVPETVDGEAWLVWQHGRNQQSVSIQVKGHLELPQKLNVLLAMRLGEEAALEYVCQYCSPQYTCLWTWK